MMTTRLVQDCADSEKADVYANRGRVLFSKMGSWQVNFSNIPYFSMIACAIIIPSLRYRPIETSAMNVSNVVGFTR